MRPRSTRLTKVDDDRAIDELDVRVDPKIRFVGMSLGVEEIEGIQASSRDAKGVGLLVQRDLLRLRRMDSPEIDRETMVDEDPEIVVSTKCERLAASIEKRRVNLGRESKIVLEPLVTEALVIER